MTTAVVDIELREKFERFKTAMLETVPGITEEGAEKAAKAFERAFYIKQAKELAGLNAKVKDHGKTWADLGKKISAMVGGPFAELGDAIFELVPKASAAATALGAIAGGAVGIAAVGAAMYGLAEAAGAAEDRLTKAGLASMLPPEARTTLQDYDDATEALRHQVDLLTVALGQGAAQSLTTVALAATGAISKFDELKTASEGVTGPMSEIGEALSWLSPVKWELAAANAIMGKFAEEGERVAESQEKIANANSDAHWDGVIAQMEREEALRKEGEKEGEKAANKRIENGKRVFDARKALAEAEMAELIRAEIATNAHLEQLEEEHQAREREKLQAHNDALTAGTLASWQAITEQTEAAVAEATAAIEGNLDAALAGLEEQRAMTLSALSGITDVAAAAQMLADFQVEKGGEGAQRAFEVSKALALAQIAMSTASAVMEAAPNPFLIAGTIALGTAQAAIVAQQKPPEFPGGGIVQPSQWMGAGTRTPDHMLIGAQPGEGVVNRRGMDELGADGLRALNQGRGGGGTIVVQQVYGHRVFDSFVQDNIRRGGPLAKALSKARKPGQTRRP